MSKNIIREDIFHILESINEQVDSMKGHSGKIPQIELDITMSYIRRLYESCKELNKANQLLPDADQETTTKPEGESPAVVLGKGIPIIHPDDEVENKEPAEPADDQINSEKHETAAPPPEEVSPEHKTKEPQKKESPLQTTTADLFSETGEITIAERFKDNKKSLNEKIAQEKNDDSIGTKMQHTPVSDLKAAIGINEKFLFMNELFSGSIKEYNQAIENLNTRKNIEEAASVIDNYQREYNWDTASGTYTQFFEVVKRRFS